MPTTYTDQFWVMDPYNPPPVGTLLAVSDFDIVDQNDNDLINRFSNDSIDGSDIRSSYAGDTVTVTLSDGSTVTITGVTFYLADGREVFTPTDGSTLQDATLVSTSWVSGQSSVTPTELEPICFAAGTNIATASGEKPVQDLKAGDVVVTVDRGLAKICFVHTTAVTSQHLRLHPNHRPVRIAARSLGQGLPENDLVVSPQHRILIRSDVAERMFGDKEILVPACQLVGQPGISRIETDQPIDYVHFMLDHHGIVFAEGAPSETLFLGAQAQDILSQRETGIARSKLPVDVKSPMEPARLFVRGNRLRRLLERHNTNNKPLLDRSSNPLWSEYQQFA